MTSNKFVAYLNGSVALFCSFVMGICFADNDVSGVLLEAGLVALNAILCVINIKKIK